MTMRQYLEKTCIKHCAFAKKCGLEKSAFSRYLNGSRKIPVEICARIKKESGGRITEFDLILNSCELK